MIFRVAFLDKGKSGTLQGGVKAFQLGIIEKDTQDGEGMPERLAEHLVAVVHGAVQFLQQPVDSRGRFEFAPGHRIDDARGDRGGGGGQGGILDEERNAAPVQFEGEQRTGEALADDAEAR